MTAQEIHDIATNAQLSLVFSPPPRILKRVAKIERRILRAAQKGYMSIDIGVEPAIVDRLLKEKGFKVEWIPYAEYERIFW
jgi:hypothetical protein